MTDLVIAGAGMAGLVAAATARALGASVLVREKGHRAGGSMLLSSGVIWRHGSFESFREECPGGDPDLQRAVFERLPADLQWLEGLGVTVRERDTVNPATSGMRFDTSSLTDTLARLAGSVSFGDPLQELPDVPVILATGGFAANRELVREHITSEADQLLLRATPWSTGDGLALGLEAGGRASSGMGEFYGRNMPDAPAIGEADFVPLAQLYAHHAVVEGPDGVTFRSTAWSEIDVVQWTAGQRGARARYHVARATLSEQGAGGRTVAELIAAAERAGAAVEWGRQRVSVPVVAGITTTLGGLAVGCDCRVAPGVYAAGGDVGGIATGGYASGLAAALVLGRLAAEQALEAG